MALWKHMAVPLEKSAGVNDQDRSVNITTKAARRMDFGPVSDLQVANNLAMDYDFAHPNISMNDGVVTDYQSITPIDGAVKVTVDPNDA